MPNILTHIIEQQTGRYGRGRVAFTTIDTAARTLRPCSWGEFADRVEHASCALEMLGIKPQQNIAILAPNCSEILVTDFACYRNRAVPVSIYATSSADQVKYIVNDASAQAIFAGTQAHYDIARKIAAECPSMKHIVAFDSDIVFEDGDSTSLHFNDFLALGAAASAECRAEVALRAADANPDDIATLIYTSGTTGEPKGAILPHSCFDAAIDMHRARLDTLSDKDTSVCFLPLSHIFEKAWTYFCLTMGIRVDINPNPKEIQTAVKVAKPTCMCSVPRFWEKVYSAVQEKISSTRGITKIMFERALAAGAKRNLEYVRTGRKAPWLVEQRYQFYNKLVFSKMRAAIGLENGRFFPTAGAPLSSAIVEFMHACGINIIIGYGLSETTATVSCYPTVGYEFGTVGTTLSDVHVKIGENNEILVKGPTVMRGYFGRPDTDNSVFTPDGWFRTGDAGRFDENGSLILTERLKDLFKTSNGKYIAPQAIESRLGEDRYIEQVAVIGDQRKYVTAFIVPAFEALKEYAGQKGISYNSIDDLVNNSEIRRFIAERIEKLQKGLAGFEKIKKFTLLPREFTIEAGELTNTLKIRRPVINSAYADEIEAMYC